MSRHHHWTAEEDALLRELYAIATAAEIAERILGCRRAVKAVYRRAVVLGLRKRESRRHSPELLEDVRRLHAQGLTDADIGRQLGYSRHCVHAIRYDRMKLPPNAAAVKEANRRGVKTQLAALGLANPAELRALSYRRYAAENGWPVDLSPRAVQILNLLAAAGVPLTRPQIAAGVGMPWKGSRRSLTSNDPEGRRSYLAHLAARGLVSRLVCAGPRPGKGRNLDLYQLGLEALILLARRAQEESCPRSKEITV